MDTTLLVSLLVHGSNEKPKKVVKLGAEKVPLSHSYGPYGKVNKKQ